MKTKLKKGFLIVLTAIMILSLAACSDNGTTETDEVEPLKVGWARYTEQSILGYMTAILIEENLDIPVELSADLGGTAIAHDAIIEGVIDVSVDYTGDAL